MLFFVSSCVYIESGIVSAIVVALVKDGAYDAGTGTPKSDG